MSDMTDTHSFWAYYKKSLPLRLSMRVALAMGLLLAVTLTVMFIVSRKAMKEDALHRASQTLEGAMVEVDNILLSVEETTGNMYYHMLPQLNKPGATYEYSRKVIEVNPYIVDCQIVYGDSIEIKHATEQKWFSQTMKDANPMWLNPLESMQDRDSEPVISFCLPIMGADDKAIGVMKTDVSLSLLSEAVANTKPTPNSYCALLDRQGKIIVHPTGKQLMQPDAFSIPGEIVHDAVNAIISGEEGYMPFSIAGLDFYIFYKPFKRAVVPNRSMERLGWSIAVIMSKEDIFGEFYLLFNYVVAIGFSGLLLLFVLCWLILSLRLRQVRMLTDKVQHIVKGHYEEPIPRTKGRDEIGRLQRKFIKMRRAVAEEIAELEDLTKSIQQQGRELKRAYKDAKKADKMKSAFMHNMTDQMVAPAQTIDKDVVSLCDHGKDGGKQDVAQLVNDIQQQGNTITQVLNQVLNLSEEEMRKEVDHD